MNDDTKQKLARLRATQEKVIREVVAQHPGLFAHNIKQRSPIWRPTTENLPGLQAGDRVLVLLPSTKIIILEATSLATAWHSPDYMYSGYWPSQGIAWALERDVREQALEAIL